MAKFINTRKAVSELEDLIKNAKEKLILVSPYLQLSKDFKELLKYRNNHEKITTIIYREQKLKPDDMKFLQDLRFVILRYHENLHAKCYMNDDTMIITSLNLFEFSMAHNKEMGVLISRLDEHDEQLFKSAEEELNYINETSQKFEFTPLKPSLPFANKTKPTYSTHKVNSHIGYCIRTGVKIPFDLERPFSYEAFQIWNQFADPSYPEKFCHFSGEPSKGETSYDKPIMSKNWKKASEVSNSKF